MRNIKKKRKSEICRFSSQTKISLISEKKVNLRTKEERTDSSLSINQLRVRMRRVNLVFF